MVANTFRTWPRFGGAFLPLHDAQVVVAERRTIGAVKRYPQFARLVGDAVGRALEHLAALGIAEPARCIPAHMHHIGGRPGLAAHRRFDECVGSYPIMLAPAMLVCTAIPPRPEPRPSCAPIGLADALGARPVRIETLCAGVLASKS